MGGGEKESPDLFSSPQLPGTFQARMRSLPAVQRSDAHAGPRPAAPPCRGKPAADHITEETLSHFCSSRNSLLSPWLGPCQLASDLRGWLEILGVVFLAAVPRSGAIGVQHAPVSGARWHRQRGWARTGAFPKHLHCKTVENVPLPQDWGGGPGGSPRFEPKDAAPGLGRVPD